MKTTRRRVFWYQVISFVLLTSMGCSFLDQIWPSKPTPEGAVSNPLVVDSESASGAVVEAAYVGNGPGIDDDGDGFRITLGEGSETPQEITPIEPVDGEPLTQAQIDAILARLPELVSEEGDQVDFNVPPDILPPPRPGETIEVPFPPEEDAAAPDEGEAGPLEVLRYSPEGEISVAPFISVTFNQPMVPLATLQQLDEADVPVDVEPDLDGDWRWIGTKTLAFYYASDLIDRMPKATEYVVTVPAGTKSVTGGELAEAVTWRFTTPAPVLVNSYPYPYEPQELDPLFFAVFDQRIDPEAVLEFTQTTADNRPFEVRLATEEEIEEAELGYLSENAPDGRWLAFKALEELPKDASIDVVFQSGMPSAEGPLTTPSNQSYSFSTYPPLKIVEHGCSWWGDEECFPLQPFYIEFNNPLDPAAYTEDMITIDPPIVGATVNVIGNSIAIQGQTEAQTNYRVTVDKD
ncbi:MAG: Ig-like domain-containing protein, partial [Anaerolineae bacterium]|nr:Ig-like domain-containing protein [Anaerolineae bacterium]